MRVNVLGDSGAARSVRGLLSAAGFHVTTVMPLYTIEIEQSGDDVVVDGIHSALEANIVTHIADCLEAAGVQDEIRLHRIGGVTDDRAIKLVVPQDETKAAAIERGILRGMLDTRQTPARPRVSWRFVLTWIAIAAVLAFALLSGRAHAQTSPNGSAPVPVNCVSGCSGSSGPSASQLPALLDPFGYLKTHEQGTANVSVQNSSLAITAAALPLPANAAQETSGNLAAIKTDVDKLPADPAREGGNLAAIKTDVDKLPADPAREGGNLATIATNSATAATAARQDTGNASLAAIAASQPAQVNGSQPVSIVGAPSLLAPPALTQQQMSNPLLYKAAMKNYCKTNLCPN